MKLQNKKNNTLVLPINCFVRITELFKQKGWPFEGEYNYPIFDNFCNLVAEYNIEQRDLLIELMEKFLWVKEHEYNRYFSTTLDKFIKSYSFERGKKIYFCPMLPEEDFGKDKSSLSLLYRVKAHLSAIQSKYSEFDITYADSPNRVNFDYIKNNFTLCLIDDFIGTGETAEKAADYIMKYGITKNQFVFLSLVSMKAGTGKLLEKGYTTYSALECEKGISAHGTPKQIDIMNSIEDNIRVNDQNRFGYGQSEALVRMMRTPNNTFPIFWFHKKNINKYAPFPR